LQALQVWLREMVRQSVARKLGSVYSTKQWFIEYNGNLSNHLAHGVIALEHLGASDDRIQEFVQVYEQRTKLRPAENVLQEADQRLNIKQFERGLVGARRNFYGLQEFYAQAFAENGRDQVIREYLPQTLRGMSGALLHNMIHLGYGYRSQAEHIVLEGMAYMHHSCLPLAKSIDEFTERTISSSLSSSQAPTASFDEFVDSFITSMNRMRSEGKITDLLQTRCHEADDWSNSRPQNQLRLISLHGIELLDDLTRDIPLTPSISWYVDLLIKVLVETTYVRETGKDAQYDFVLLHGATCSWALHQLEHLVDARYAQYCLANTLFAVLAIQGIPHLEFCEIHQTHAPWEELLPALVARDLDEHAYKLGAVAHERFLSCDANCPGELYKQACSIVTHLGSTLQPVQSFSSL